MRVGQPLEPLLADQERILDAWQSGGVRGLVVGRLAFLTDYPDDLQPPDRSGAAGATHPPSWGGGRAGTAWRLRPQPHRLPALGRGAAPRSGGDVHPAPGAADAAAGGGQAPGLVDLPLRARGRGGPAGPRPPRGGRPADHGRGAPAGLPGPPGGHRQPVPPGGRGDPGRPRVGLRDRPRPPLRPLPGPPPEVEPAAQALGFDYGRLVGARDRLHQRLHKLVPGGGHPQRRRGRLLRPLAAGQRPRDRLLDRPSAPAA